MTKTMNVIGLVLATLAVGCVLPADTRARSATFADPTARRAQSSAPEPNTVSLPHRRASGLIAVRLSPLESRETLEVKGTTKGTCVLVRRGDKISENGGNPVDEVQLAARGAPFEIAERRYRGGLRVRARRDGPGLEVTNLVDLEDYIAGVVAREVVLWTYDVEALRAQAIASRSYAVAALDERGRKRADPYLFSDVRDQAYEGVFVPRNARERELVLKLARALESTRGVVLLEGERVVDARFHASCGGATADARVVFPEANFECLRSVSCPACSGILPGSADTPSAAPWKWTAPREKLDEIARAWKLGTTLQRLRASKTDASGRWLEVEVEGDAATVRESFERWRRALGADKLLSSRITRMWPPAGELITGGLAFEGRGRGHGVGLCQEAARACARAGWTAERILAHYYPGARSADFR